MDIIIAVYVFVLGLAFGSFSLAMVTRMKSGRDWVKGRSECDYCKHKLSARDLIPVFSWLQQRGACRYCKKKLSVAYPIAELGLGLAFLISWLHFPYVLSGAGYILFVFWLLCLIIMSGLVIFDLRWYLLPNRLVYPLIAVAFLHRITVFLTNDEYLADAFLETSAALVVGSGLFWVLHKVSRGKWIGDGDYRLGIATGLLLANPFNVWLSLFLASVFGVVYAVYISTRKKNKKKKNKAQMKIPFGPFLILGLYCSYLFGEQFIDWYSSTFLYL